MYFKAFPLDSPIEHMYDKKVFERLASAVEEIDIPPVGDAVAEVLELIDRLTAKVSAAVGEFDAEGGWALEGATSAVAWLRHRAGMTSSTANNTVRTARSLRQLPVTAAAWRDGSLSGGQVQAITKNVNDRSLALFADDEASVVPALTELSVRDTATVMQMWAARAEALLDDDGEPRLPERSVYLSGTLHGRYVLDGDLDPEGGSIVATAIRLASSRDRDTEDEPWRTPARRRADALVDVCRWFLDHQQHRPGGRHRPHLNVVIDYEDLIAGSPGRLLEGGMLDGPSIRRLLCDSAVHRVVTDGRSSILDYGTSTRTVPANLWAALVLRDRHCRHDGCDRPSRWCEAHHVTPVLEGGATSLDNLVLKCSRHHHVGHLPGWHEKLRPDGTLVTTNPAGRTRTTRPPGV